MPSSPSSWNLWERIDEAAWSATDRAAQPEIGSLFQPGRAAVEWQRDRNRQGDRFSTAEWCRRNDRKGTLIRHASRRVTLPVRTLPVAMIEPALQTPLVAAVGSAALPAPSFRCGKPGCNSAVRDRSANKSRMSPGIPGCDKLAAGEPLLHEPPSRPTRRTLTMATVHARVEPV